MATLDDVVKAIDDVDIDIGGVFSQLVKANQTLTYGGALLDTLTRVIVPAVNAYMQQVGQPRGAGDLQGQTPGVQGVGDIVKAMMKAMRDAAKEEQEKGEEAKKKGGGFASALTVLPRAIAAAETAILRLGNSMLGMVAKANPAAAQRWELAVSDLLATLGAALAPVLELVTAVVRTMADAFTLLIPVGAELAGALKPVFDLIGEALAGAIGYLASALKAVVPVFGVVIRMFMDLVGWLGRLLKEGLALLGIDVSPEQAKKGASVGMAARPAQIGAVDEVLKTAMRASFSVGLGGGDPAAKTASEAKRIRELTDYIYAEVKALPDRIGAFLQDLPGNIARAIARGLPDSQDAVANTFAAAAAAGGGNATIAGAVAQQMNTLRLLDLSPATGLAGQMSPW